MEGKEKYYHFSIQLDSPYKWGSGYGKATLEEIRNNEIALEETRKFFDFKLQKSDGVGCDVWYKGHKDLDEVYCHPQELSGTLKEKDIYALKKFIQGKNFPNTKVKELFIYAEEKYYTFEEITKKIINKVDEIIPLIANDDSRYCFKYQVAGNYRFEDFGMKFKKYCFAKTAINKEIEMQKDFCVKLINEKLAKYWIVKENSAKLEELQKKYPANRIEYDDKKECYIAYSFFGDSLFEKENIDSLEKELEKFYANMNKKR